MAEPLAILGGAYTDETRPLSSQDTCNYILFPAEKAGTRTEGQLIDAPGLVPFAGVGDGPHRGGRDVEGKLFVVSGNKLYQVAPTGVATEIGTIPGTDRVSITHNQIENGNQVLIGTRDNSYVYNTVTGVLAATGVPLFSVDFINQLFVGVDQGRRFWRYSALVDGTDWNSLDNEGAESSPDRIVGLVVSQGEALVFGERTIEVWANSPNSSTAFQRVQVIERGCASPETICRLDNSVIFLGNDNILYRLEGYSPRPISTHVLTREWGNREPRKAFAFTYEDKGRVIYYLTHKDGKTFGYDVTTGEFHRRESYGFNRWRLNTLVKWAGQWYGGDFADGTLWKLDWRYMKEGCDEMVRYRRTGVLSDNQRRVTVNSVELLLDTGREIEEFPLNEVSVSGAMPDGIVGTVVDFTYTVQATFPGGDYTLTAEGLPPGVTMDITGHVTGAFTTAGTYPITLSYIDACGNVGSHEDSVGVGEAIEYDDDFKYIVEDGGLGNTNDYSPTAFDDSAWASAPGGFGNATSAALAGHTLNTPVAGATGRIIWLRKTFAAAAGEPLRVDAYHDDGVFLWWNGAPIALTAIQYYHDYAIIPGASVLATNTVALKVIDGFDELGNPAGSPNIYAALEISGA